MMAYTGRRHSRVLRVSKVANAITDAIIARWNATAVYRAIQGTWKSIHVHWSYIKPELKTPVSEDGQNP
jgi:hypothetical protein